MGVAAVALNHPFIDAFSIINQPAIGVPPFMETRIRLGHNCYDTNHGSWFSVLKQRLRSTTVSKTWYGKIRIICLRGIVSKWWYAETKKRDKGVWGIKRNNLYSVARTITNRWEAHGSRLITVKPKTIGRTTNWDFGTWIEFPTSKSHHKIIIFPQHGNKIGGISINFMQRST